MPRLASAARRLLQLPGECDEQRRFRRLRRGAVAGLAVLTVIAVAAAVIAVVQRQEANRQRNEAIARWLVSEAQPILQGAALSDSPVHAYQRLVAARRLAQTPDDGPLVDALRRNGVPVGYFLFAGEQHGFRQAGNIQRALDAELYFYSIFLSGTKLAFAIER